MHRPLQLSLLLAVAHVEQPLAEPAGSPNKRERMFAGFKSFRELQEKWFLPGDPKVRKKHLQQAFKAVKPVLRFLAKAEEYPPGLDPIDFANQVISLRQEPRHIQMAIPLIMAVLDKTMSSGLSFRKQCRLDSQEMRRSCQDLFALLCNALHMLEESGKLGTVRDFSAKKCVEEYDAPRPIARRFGSPARCHRQLPGLTARAWWPAEDVPYSTLAPIRFQISTIQEEVSQVVSATEFQGWDPLNNDPTLTSNANWDPRASWDAIPLFFRNEWQEKGCGFFPITCGILRQAPELERLCNTSRYAELVPEAVRVTQDYDEVPSLGIKLYRIWPGAGLKSHTGSPARLVSSVALHAPANSTITVAGESRPWISGVMQHFDDAFFHSVDNPHTSEFRIVLAIMTWHPDLEAAARHSDTSESRLSARDLNSPQTEL